MKTTLKCQCGQRIFRRDVVRRASYFKQSGPGYVYIKYRCSRCKKLGEHFIRQEEWREALLREVPNEVAEADRTRFQTLGPITIDEMLNVHREMAGLDTIPNPLDDERA